MLRPYWKCFAVETYSFEVKTFDKFKISGRSPSKRSMAIRAILAPD